MKELEVYSDIMPIKSIGPIGRKRLKVGSPPVGSRKKVSPSPSAIMRLLRFADKRSNGALKVHSKVARTKPKK